MTRIRIIAIVLASLLLAGKWGLDQFAWNSLSGPLEGTWEITSVQRGGSYDRMHVGSHLTFAGNAVTLQSNWLLGEASDAIWSVAGLEGIPYLTPIGDEARQAIEMSALS